MMTLTLGELYGACERDEQQVLPSAVALAHLDLAARVFGPGWEMKPVDAVSFEDGFPPKGLAEDDPRRRCFGSKREYLVWRAALLKLLIALTGRVQDLWLSLGVLGRAHGIAGIADLKAPLQHALGAHVDPASLSRDGAIAAEADLSGLPRQRFRQACRILDQLRALDVVRDRQLLGSEPIGVLPMRRPSGRRSVPLPPRLAAFHQHLTLAQKTALKVVVETGVATGCLAEGHDVSPLALIEHEMYTRLQPALAEAGLRSGEIYLQRLVSAVLQEYPQAPHPHPWQELRRRAKEQAPRPALDRVRILEARSNGRSPGALDQDWLDGELATADRSAAAAICAGVQQLNELRNVASGALAQLLPEAPLVVAPILGKRVALPGYMGRELDAWARRSGASGARVKVMRCALRCLHAAAAPGATFDALLDRTQIDRTFHEASHLSPTVREQYRRAAHRFAAAQPGEPSADWENVLDHAKKLGLSRDDRHALGALRAAALRAAPPLGPTDLERGWIVELLDGDDAGTTKERWRRATVVLDALVERGLPAQFHPPARFGPLTRRARAGSTTLPRRILDDLCAHCRFRGLSETGARSVVSSLRAVHAAAPDPTLFDGHALSEVPLALVISEIDARVHAPVCDNKTWARQRANVLQLADELSVIWTPDWFRLQAAVVAAGVAVAENPVPDLAQVALAAGIASPVDLDREWAWLHEARLRPDLRITWSRAIDRFDRLRDCDAIRSTGLLPGDPLGPMPARGSRAKHGRYPLPRGIEAALDSRQLACRYSWQQLNETAHFVWRYARENGIFARGQDVSLAEFLAPVVLETVFRSAGQGPAALREHRRRIDALRAGAFPL